MPTITMAIFVCEASEKMTTPNPYEPPRAAIDGAQWQTQESVSKAGTVTRSRALLIGYWLMFFASFALPIFAVFVVPSFEEVFQSFGAELPFFTLAVIKYRLALWVCPFFAFVPALLFSLDHAYEKRVYARYKVSFFILLIAFGCSFFAAVLAMYLPIFNLGSVV